MKTATLSVYMKIRAGIVLMIAALMVTNLAQAAGQRISGPYTVKNLSIYLIHGQDRATNMKFMTLAEAMKRRKVKVHETGNVNKLKIENLSAKENIYIQAGDIVKGGKQDRVFSTDLILEPRSGKVDISAFCVERGRWAKRGKEKLKQFSGSSKVLASRKLRLATKLKKSQGAVWSEVSQLQRKMAASAGKSVRNNMSATSLQLTLEDKSVSKGLKDYRKKLIDIVKGKKDVIGFAFAINGKLNNADVYANNRLFVKLWPKLLEAAATEAWSEYRKDKKVASPKPQAIRKWFSEAKKGRRKRAKVSKTTSVSTTEGAKDVQFETYVKGDSKTPVHTNYMKK